MPSLFPPLVRFSCCRWLFFIINDFKLVATYAVDISSPTHACIRAPPTLVYGGYNYLARQNGDSVLASLPLFKGLPTNNRDLYGVAIFKLVLGHVR